MSGKPYPNGVLRLARHLRERQEAQEKIAHLEELIRRTQGSIEEARMAERTALAEAKKLMQEMDVHAPGNFGYEARLLWVLQELSAQPGRCEVAVEGTAHQGA